MGRNSASLQIDETAAAGDTATTTSAADAAADSANATTSTAGLGFHSIRDRIRFKRNPTSAAASYQNRAVKSHRPPRGGLFSSNRSHRKGFLYSWFPFRGAYFYYFVVFFAVFAFAMASMVLQSSITRLVSSRGWSEDQKLGSEGLRFGSTFKFVPGSRSMRIAEGDGLDQVRSMGTRLGLRPPRLAVILGNMKNGPQSLMLVTVMRNLQKLGYVLQIYAVKDGEARSTWEQIGGQISILRRELYGRIDWSTFEGVVADSVEAKETISSLMQEPFCSVPLIWIIQEDTLSNRLSVYEEMGWQYLTSNWREALKRASVVVFPDFTLPMLYSVLDTGNFFVIPGSPVDAWAAESYSRTHVKLQLRTDNGFSEDDVVVLVVGSSFFYDQLSWDYAVAMHTLGPLLIKYARRQANEGSFKFVFLCGNSTDGDALQEVASRLGIPDGFVRHFGLNSNVNSMLLMADIFLYDSSQDEQGFPPLIIRAMTFEIPVIAPDIPVMKRYVTDGVHGLLFQRYNPEALATAFSLLISEGKLSTFGQTVASYGKLLAKNIQALECVTGYARLLENALSFPSDVLLPGHASELQQNEWEWEFFEKQTLQNTNDLLGTDVEDSSFGGSSIVYSLEEELPTLHDSTNISENGTRILAPDVPTKSDWGVLREIESLEDYERLEMEELEGREDRNPGLWEDIYRNARKSEKLKFELNERDEGELERIGQPVCIYEIYNGAGAWPFLHHGSLYRGLSLSRKGRRPRSDDVDAVSRLRILNDTYYRNLLCEVGGMFSVANKVDDIHKRPWIGFQSWRAASRKVSLSTMAEKVLEETIQKETKGNVMYFWAYLDVDSGVTGNNHQLTFWSMCDILNGGHCRTAFEAAFRQMYALPSHLEALLPMPEDGGHWSALHSWVMPTPSFVEFVMFARMFVDSLDALGTNSSKVLSCLLSSSAIEEKHCYCRIMELLVNVWAYHSARKMVYMDPQSGYLEEQHPVEERKEIWAKYFNVTLLKSMDEDLAEAADDKNHPRERWLWPMTGEVHWQGIYEREREERYRAKMDKKRKTKEKLYERLKTGYKQKPLRR
ncbi:UDP-Glycosyltransferase superfamily protein [Euphorbia peplus]|nr:UDP-Glycosyltransferase superfamily protein [Euphorbia peplus]